MYYFNQLRLIFAGQASEHSGNGTAPFERFEDTANSNDLVEQVLPQPRPLPVYMV